MVKNALIALVGGLVVGLLWWLSSVFVGRDSHETDRQNSHGGRLVSRAAKLSAERTESRISPRKRKGDFVDPKIEPERAREQILSMLVDLPEDVQLTEAEQEIIRQLQALLGDLSLSPEKLRAELSKLLAKLSTLGGRNASFIKLAAIRASALAGSGSAVDVMPFLADENADVRAFAMETYVESISDFTLGDRERAQLVIAAAMTLTDASSLDWTFGEFGNMRHSVAADAMAQIMQGGTDMAKERVVDAARFYTGEDTVDTVDALEEWLQRNPDGEDDEAFYGPPQEGSGIGI